MQRTRSGALSEMIDQISTIPIISGLANLIDKARNVSQNLGSVVFDTGVFILRDRKEHFWFNIQFQTMEIRVVYIKF
jgi:hypothetical protein